MKEPDEGSGCASWALALIAAFLICSLVFFAAEQDKAIRDLQMRVKRLEDVR